MLKFYVTMQTLFIAGVDRVQNAKDSERGATAVEYGIMVALIAGVIIAIVATIGKQLLAGFTKVNGLLPGLT